jgi:hypothetical protein
MREKLPLVNIATEPVQVREMAQRCFGQNFSNIPDTPPAQYDMQTQFARYFGAGGRYQYTADQTFEEIRRFAEISHAGASA